MTNINEDMFNLDNLKEKLGKDPFAEQNVGRTRDERFYVLKRDADDKGMAVIRFLPDKNMNLFQRVFKISTSIKQQTGKSRWFDGLSPQTIGKPCPFQEKWKELYESGDTEGAKVYSRKTAYIANIKVLKDPACPENEGKIFLYSMSSKVKNRVVEANDPSQEDIDLGVQPKEMFNPLKGHNFILRAARGETKQINYDKSEIFAERTSIYDSPEECMKDIQENTYDLSMFLQDGEYETYDVLLDKLYYVQGKEKPNNSSSEHSVETVETVEKVSVEAKDQSELTGFTNDSESVKDVHETKNVETGENAEKAKKVDEVDDMLDGLV